MFRFITGSLVIMVLYFNLFTILISKERREPDIIIRHSRMLLEGEKRYVDDIERGEKRYVSDREEADEETKRYLGWKKLYVGEESEEEYFRLEKEALYRFTSLQKNPEKPIEPGSRLSVVVEEQDAVSGEQGIKAIEEKDKLELNNERISLDNKRTVENNKRVSLNNKRTIENNERTSLNNKRVIENNERTSLNNKRVKLDIPKVTIEN